MQDAGTPLHATQVALPCADCGAGDAAHVTVVGPASHSDLAAMVHPSRCRSRTPTVRSGPARTRDGVQTCPTRPPRGAPSAATRG